MTCITCNDECFLFCSLCQQAFCPEHKCFHLGSFENSYEDSYDEKDSVSNRGRFKGDSESQSWLSYNTIISTMPDAKIREAITRYKALIHELQAELSHRSSHSVRPASHSHFRINKCTAKPGRARDTKVERVFRTITKFGLSEQVINILKGVKK